MKYKIFIYINRILFFPVIYSILLFVAINENFIAVISTCRDRKFYGVLNFD